MGKPGPFVTIIVILGTLVNVYALLPAVGIRDTLNDNPDDVSEALGNAFAFVILISFWWVITFVALIFLVIGKLYKQNKLIVFVNGGIVAGHWYYAGIPILSILEGSTADILQSAFGTLFSLLVLSLMVMKGMLTKEG